MQIGHIILVILGLLFAGFLMYSAKRLVKGIERREGPFDEGN